MSEVTSKSKSAKEDRPRSKDEILGPSKEEKAAATFNRKHPEVAAEFTKLTGVDASDYKAVKAWQLAHNLPGDGKIGPATMKAAAVTAPKQEAKVEGEKSAGDAEAAPAPAPAEPDDEQAPTDPSVAALFDGTQSTDQEQGTDEHAVKAQAAACRVALQKHLTDFQLASRNGVDIAMQSVRERKGRVKTDSFGSSVVGKVTRFAVKLAWEQCGGAAFIKDVMGIVKEELLGDFAEHAEKAYEAVKGQLEKFGHEADLKDVAGSMQMAINENTQTFVERGGRQIASADAKSLAEAWRLIKGTTDNMTVKGDKLAEEDKATVTTEMLEQVTGIEVGGGAAMRLANTILQEALVQFALIVVGNDAREEALGDAMRGDGTKQNEQSAKEIGVMGWVKDDQEKRDRVHE